MPATVIDVVAWIEIRAGTVLTVRSHGSDTFWIPGGKTEPEESELDALCREAHEELGVVLDPASARLFGRYDGHAHGQPPHVRISMACYRAEATGVPRPCAEIAELDWFGWADRDRVADADRRVFDDLHRAGLLR
ncbi:ADP-ribose pyrophosphatase YjhB (NUDIX family) [Stackebrandtia albiflava]|uniref:ADP-ribose pyrophosphatase YjhB (NUDIX family) n=1 Tax=Stackebrandtia albiflava TaxID=406432 RepID=A0A562ULP0_9ACTN|nr:NUDIX domain-containing protein [Stackebrandtia albiflava]TWJ06527.1 ADP-ribose pyrophosphatase YjhB (NUDIX family) [Stackebrandtia albiflava]